MDAAGRGVGAVHAGRFTEFVRSCSSSRHVACHLVWSVARRVLTCGHGHVTHKVARGTAVCCRVTHQLFVLGADILCTTRRAHLHAYRLSDYKPNASTQTPTTVRKSHFLAVARPAIPRQQPAARRSSAVTPHVAASQLLCANRRRAAPCSRAPQSAAHPALHQRQVRRLAPGCRRHQHRHLWFRCPTDRSWPEPLCSTAQTL